MNKINQTNNFPSYQFIIEISFYKYKIYTFSFSQLSLLTNNQENFKKILPLFANIFRHGIFIIILFKNCREESFTS